MLTRLNAFVPAAGLGERLLPMTAHIAKPLLPVLGRPLLSSALERVSALPVERIGINLHHKGEAITAWVEDSPYRDRAVFFPEDPLLDTGGALKNAEGLLGEGVFLVHNSDILTDIDLHALVEAHTASGNVATLALHDYPIFNKVAVRDDGAVVGVGDVTAAPGESRRVAFTGIAVCDPAFLTYLPEGASSVRDAWMAAVSDGRTVGSVDVTGCRWRDLGTPASYAAAVAEALRGQGEWVHVDATIPEGDVDLDGYVVIEKGCSLGDGATLRNCIVLPGAHVDNGAQYENCIVGDGFRIDLTEPEMLGLPVEEDGLQIGVGGSERRYYRVRSGEKSAVRMVCAPEEPDYERHIAYSRFFARHGVPVPALHASDAEAMRAEFEDLGDLSLYNWLRYPRSAERIEEVYRRVLDILVVFHVDATRHLDECDLLRSRIFDFDYFRWETDYFLERFVEGRCAIRPASPAALEEEFDRLGRRADGLPKGIIHRDFQSQNVMLKDGVPRVVDYQGARVGPAAYDVASILWDPYIRLEDAMRQRLVAYYMDAMAERAGAALDAQPFFERLVICRLQRHMQALGAYGFLTLVRGKPYFAKHIPEALRLLRQDLVESQGAWPAIAETVEACAGGKGER
jgi:NDP-sugar pyrophosphorylase family protein/aminoglycoside/choline kinase family phosphotransferase